MYVLVRQSQIAHNPVQGTTARKSLTFVSNCHFGEMIISHRAGSVAKWNLRQAYARLCLPITAEYYFQKPPTDWLLIDSARLNHLRHFATPGDPRAARVCVERCVYRFLFYFISILSNTLVQLRYSRGQVFFSEEGSVFLSLSSSSSVCKISRESIVCPLLSGVCCPEALGLNHFSRDLGFVHFHPCAPNSLAVGQPSWAEGA